MSAPDSNCHLQLGLTPPGPDKWHFYESSQNHKGTSLNKDKNGPKTEEVNKVVPGVAYRQICHMCIEAQMFWSFYDCFHRVHQRNLASLELLTFPQHSTPTLTSPRITLSILRDHQGPNSVFLVVLGTKCCCVRQIPGFLSFWRVKHWIFGGRLRGYFVHPLRLQTELQTTVTNLQQSLYSVQSLNRLLELYWDLLNTFWD